MVGWHQKTKQMLNSLKTSLLNQKDPAFSKRLMCYGIMKKSEDNYSLNYEQSKFDYRYSVLCDNLVYTWRLVLFTLYFTQILCSQ